MEKQSIKEMPRHLKAEEAVLGGILIDPQALPRVLDILHEDSFYRERHRIIYASILGLHIADQPIDWLTLTTALKDAGQLEQVGGITTLTKLADAVPSAANIEMYAKMVQEKAVARKIISACDEIQAHCYHHKLNDAVSALNDLAYIQTIGQSPTIAAWDTINEQQYREYLKALDLNEAPGLLTGLKDLDALTHGFRKGHLNIIAARPSMGKSALVRNMSLFLQKRETGFLFSLEMDRREIWEGIVAATGSISADHITKRKLSSDEFKHFTKTTDRLYGTRLVIDDAAVQTPASIEANVRSWCVRNNVKPGFVIVDHIGLMDDDQPGSRYDQQSAIARKMKRLAKQLDTTIILLCQLNRKVEDRPLSERMPRLSDLRDTGELEQSANTVIAFYRPYVYTKDSKMLHDTYVSVIKNRGGRIGNFELYWDPEYVLFRDHTKRVFDA